jgi:hypothetical protein
MTSDFVGVNELKPQKKNLDRANRCTTTMVDRSGSTRLTYLSG